MTAAADGGLAGDSGSAGGRMALGRMRLREIAHGRSGDKGNHANIGVIAYTPEGFAFLGRELTAAKVHAFFASLDAEGVERFSLPGILAFNFLLRNVLGGGASDSLRTDSQGKVLATALLEMELPRPEDWEAMTRRGTPA